MIVDLRGKWQFSDCNEGENRCGNVPSSNVSDLLSLSALPDPFVKTNEKSVSHVGDKDWKYLRTFYISDELFDYDKIFLHCLELDTVCDIFINNKFVAHSLNCHIPLKIDVKNFLHDGENNIEIKFYSPVNYVNEKYKARRTPTNANGRNGVAHIRKPQCHFGWDWGPVLPISGISGNIYLEGVINAELSDLTVKQIHNADGSVKLELCAQAENFSNKPLSAEFEITCPNGEKIKITEVSINITENLKTIFYYAETVILSPELWWTKELSGKEVQSLYDVKALLKIEDKEISQKCIRIGLRTIELDRSLDRYGENFCFLLNGKKVFCKGANYIPPDSLITRVSDDDYRTFVQAAIFSNMNMLRVWGGGYYAPEALLDECDLRGILVWQDFAFACQAYPFFDDEFRALTINEARIQIKRMRSHPSLAIWCGNVEIEQMSTAWFYALNYLKWTKKYFYEILPLIVKEEDDRPYIATSPVGAAYKKGVFADNVGDTHLWSVWHGLQPLSYYSKRYTRFCSEFGFESLPCMKTLRSFAKEQDFNLNSEVFLAHQKCKNGNMKMQYYALERFHLPSKFSDYVYLSQFCQSECVRNATEHWRRNKGRCNGSLYWQLNDCWPVCSWSSMDYFKRYKILQYTARKFFAPVAVSIEKSKYAFNIFTLNDTLETFKCEVVFKLCDYTGKVLFEEKNFTISNAEKSEKQLSIATSKIKTIIKKTHCFAVAYLYKNGVEVSRSVLLLNKEKNANLPAPKIEKYITYVDGQLRIELSSNVFAHAVWLSSEFSDEHFSDNCFDILPNERLTVTLPCSSVPDDLNNAVNIFDASMLTKAHGALYEALFKLSVLLRPLNLINVLVYKLGSKNIRKKTLMKLHNKEMQK